MLGQGAMHNNLVYPLLRRFVSEGLVTQKEAEGERGQTRKLYALTARGRRTLIGRLSRYDAREALETEPFLIRVGLFVVLSPEVRERILATREKALYGRDQRFAELQERMELGLYGGDIVRHLREGIDAERRWISRLRKLEKQEGEKPK